jgi:hypothetical protein
VATSPAFGNDRPVPEAPPRPSAGILSDVRLFLLRRPPISTLLKFKTKEDREDYSHRILQRVGVSVEQYAILNIHRIGIDAPVVLVFEDLLKWNADSVWWPNHLATVTRVDGGLEHLRIGLFGRRLDSRKKTSAARVGISLFEMKAIKVLELPIAADFDNARYLLYACRGGYPIGIFTMYVRSPIADRDEQARTQVFFAVSFNFYGKTDWPRANPVNIVWEAIHNRATANIMNRFKQLCEWRFQRISSGG